MPIAHLKPLEKQRWNDDLQGADEVLNEILRPGSLCPGTL